MPKEEFCVVLPNPEIQPTFSEDTVVYLTKDYAEMDPCCSKSLKKGVYCIIKECGMSKYLNVIDYQTGYWSTANDGIEWCVIEIVATGLEPQDEEEVVKAEDLEPHIPGSKLILELE